MSRKSKPKPGHDEAARRQRDLLFQALILVIAFFTYWNVLSAHYVSWDDNVLIEQNALFKLPFWEFIRTAFSHYYDGDYFPFTLLSFWTELNALGWGATEQHVTNLVLHGLNILLVFHVLKRMNLREVHIWLICGLFAIHPVQVETVAWISERRGLLCAFFFFLSFYFYQRENLRNLFLSTVFYLASLLSKFTAVLLPVLMVAMDQIYYGRTLRSSVIRRLPLFLIGAIASLFRIMAYLPYVSESQGEFNMRLVDLGRLVQLPEMISTALCLYLKNFAVPSGLSVVYPNFQESILTKLSVLAVFLFGVMVYLRWRKSRNPELVFFSLFLFVFLLPVLQLVPRINFINDRYLYLPILGFAGLTVTLLEELLSRGQWRVPALIWMVVLAGMSNERTSIWLSDVSLWGDTVLKYPESATAHNNLGLAYNAEGKDQLAIPEFEAAIAYGEKGRLGEVAGYTNLGHLYLFSSDPKVHSLEKAQFFFKRAVEGNKRLEDGYTPRLNLAIVEMMLDKRAEAITTLRSLVSDLTRSSLDQRYEYLLERSRKMLELLTEESMGAPARPSTL